MTFIDEFIEEGIKQSIKQSKTLFVTNLLKDGSFTFEQSAHFVSTTVEHVEAVFTQLKMKK